MSKSCSRVISFLRYCRHAEKFIIINFDDDLCVSELIHNSTYTKSFYSIYLLFSSIVFDPALLPIVVSPLAAFRH